MKIALWITVILFGGLWAWLTRQNAVDGTRLAARQVENRHASVPARTADAPKTRVNSAGLAATPAGASREARPNVLRRRVNTFLQDPAREALYLKTRKSVLPAVYGPFLRARGLTAMQSAALEDLLVRREAQTLDIAGTNPDATRLITSRWGDNGPDPLAFSAPQFAAEFTAKSDPDDPAVALLRKNNQEFAAEATALLGADGLQALQSYEREMPLQPIVTSLAGSLAATPTPLTVDQAQQLMSLLADAQSSSLPLGRGNARMVDWETVLARTPAFLAADQLTALENNNAVTIQQRRFIAALGAAQGANAP